MKHEKSCGAIVFREADGIREFLIVRHQKKGKKGGHWDLPKGHMEEGESEEQTALREVKEETNLDVELVENFREGIAYSPGPGVMKAVIFFLAKALDGEVILQDEEIMDHCWLPKEEACNKLTFDSAKDLINKAHGHLNP